MDKKISYLKRDFTGLREDLVNLTKKYYPELISNFNDASIYSVLLDLNAAIADNLHFHIDRVWQETMLDFAKQKQSLFHIAKTYGLKIPGNKPSVALCDFSITVPVRGDKEDDRYEGILKAGSQFSGGGQIFETIEDIDFSVPYNSKGQPNRLKIPNRDSNNSLISYTIIKREPVVNGLTRIYKQAITDVDQKPFLKIYLPENNVLSVESVIHKDGTDFLTNPSNSEFLNSINRWYEVNSLAEDEVFVEREGLSSDTNYIKSGDYKKITKKFITEHTPEGYFSLTFGSGYVDSMENLDRYITNKLKVTLDSFINNNSLGEIPKLNSTIFVKYRIGGGRESNVGVNVITNKENVEFNVYGPVDSVNGFVKQSLRVTNITPAIGGTNLPTIEEIRQMIAYNFSSQNRAVTLNDYLSKIQTMPGKFGAPAKVNVMEEDNKVKISLLSYDSASNLTEDVSVTLKENILSYLSRFRMINDYIEVNAGEVIDLGLDVDLLINKNESQTDIIKQTINVVTEYFKVDKRKMGDHLFVGDLISKIGEISGIINVVDVKVFNKYGGLYSNSQVLQPYIDTTTKEIQQNDMIVYMKQNQIFQIRYPSTDIRIRTKTILGTSY